MRKLAAALLACLVLFTGAAFAQQDEALLTTYDLVASADYQLNNADSFAMDVIYDLAMTAEGQSIAMNVKADMKFIKDPLKMKIGLNIDASSQPESIKIGGDIYCRAENGELALYATIEGETVRIAIPGYEGLLASAAGSNTNAGSSYKSLSYERTEKLNGREVYVIKATPKLDSASKEMISTLGSSLSISNFATSLENLELMLYIDTKTYQYVRMEANLTQLTNEMLSAMDGGVTVEKYVMRMDFHDINRVKSFDVPKSVINKAKDLSSLEF